MLPLRAADGGAGPGAAGAVTGVFMAATVAAQLGVPRLLAARGPRAALGLGALALGVPTLAVPLSSAWPVLAALTAVRGVGFGIVTVTGAALVADLVPPALRGRAAGVYGGAVGAPQLVLLPAGVSLWTGVGPTPVLLAGAVLPLLALPVLPWLPAGAPRRPETSRAARREARAPRPRAWGAGPWAVMVVSAAGAGGVLTVLPLTASATTASLALLTLTAAQLLGRSAAGEVVDRRSGPGRVTPVGLALVAAGTAVVASGVPAAGAVLGGAALVGAGFGAVQNDTLVTLFARAGPDRSGVASSVWNTAYDSGTGLGATVSGVVLGAAGAPASFLLAAAVCVGILPVAVAGARRGASGAS